MFYQRVFFWLAFLVSQFPQFIGSEYAQSQAFAVQDEYGVYELTDSNFDWLTLSGEWFIDIYAPWCSHCRSLEPTWKEVAKELAPFGIKVAKIDATKNPVLHHRFAVTAYPSLYFMSAEEGITVPYPKTDHRSKEKLMNFALEGWKKQEPLPWYQSPNSLVGRSYGLVLTAPSMVFNSYQYLHQERGYSEYFLVLSGLAIPLIFGLIIICMIDIAFTRSLNQTPIYVPEQQ
eukprot:TRINITY_DN2837_c0_g2_i2.p1 TRINITY_DN2837_c0_g2~~TRINITY_DN2837_c0_g2_i2.p1  ORF type:complete len:231 (-),score=9.16 TRINITY_DN2837_c0_g2_i2:592-1284(-)